MFINCPQPYSDKGPSSQSYGFPSSMDVRVGPSLSAEELMLLNCGVEDSWESPGLQGDPTSQS